MTGFVPVMWSVWGVLVVLLLALKVYTSKLTQNEDDQIVLDDSFDHLKSEQAAIMAKVNKIAPVQRIMLWLVAAMTVVVIGYYAYDIFNQFQ
jgi:hypothetical protein